METVNMRRMAWLYYNEVRPGHYDWDVIADRNRCRAAFVKLGNVQQEAFEAASAAYMEEVRAEIDAIPLT